MALSSLKTARRSEAETRRWTRDEYHRAAEEGTFRPDERLELIDGRVLPKVSPQSDRHAAAVALTADALRAAVGRSRHVASRARRRQ